MKKNLLLVVMCLLALNTYAKKENKSVTFNVPIECENCVKKVEGNIAFEKGVTALACNLKEKTVTVTYSPEKTNVENLKKGFSKIGYDNISVKKTCCEKTKEKTPCSDKDKTAYEKNKEKSNGDEQCDKK